MFLLKELRPPQLALTKWQTFVSPIRGWDNISKIDCTVAVTILSMGRKLKPLDIVSVEITANNAFSMEKERINIFYSSRILMFFNY